ncbi:gamma-glutamylcyclotransferase [Oscillospiraceae bacterium OttesenSCG-928-G22]|nr:gamma-glutamylcyclotransferase [Oscillospiraceae bacterium OttesenSCG-928-G22]
MSKDRLYIAYGSNLNLAQMAFRCPTAIAVDTATLQGYDLLFRGAPGNAHATIEPGMGSVPVLLWKLKPKDEAALDRYEGWPHYYHKQNTTVDLGGNSVSAMVYIMNAGHALNQPSQRYFDTIAHGYFMAGFDTDVLFHALEQSYPEVDQELEEPDDSIDMDWWR